MLYKIDHWCTSLHRRTTKPCTKVAIGGPCSTASTAEAKALYFSTLIVDSYSWFCKMGHRGSNPRQVAALSVLGNWGERYFKSLTKDIFWDVEFDNKSRDLPYFLVNNLKHNKLWQLAEMLSRWLVNVMGRFLAEIGKLFSPSKVAALLNVRLKNYNLSNTLLYFVPCLGVDYLL